MKNLMLILLTIIILAISAFGKYVELNTKKIAISVYEDRLVPQPYLSRKFDYYGTTIQDKIKIVNGGKIDILTIIEEKKITDTMWAAYLRTYLTEDEKKIADSAKIYIESADEYFSEISKDEIITLEEAKIMDEKIYPVLENVNKLINIQTTIGAEDTKKIISLLNKFSNFIIGAMALAIALLGSLIYDIFKNRNTKTTKIPKARTKTIKKVSKKSTPKKKK
jgi:hypothetical protein